jgi:hypothetical protein
MTDVFDLFQEDFTSYSELMSQMSFDPGVGTFSTQYDAPRASWSVHPSARDAGTGRRKTQALADAGTGRRKIQPVSH